MSGLTNLHVTNMPIESWVRERKQRQIKPYHTYDVGHAYHDLDCAGNTARGRRQAHGIAEGMHQDPAHDVPCPDKEKILEETEKSCVEHLEADKDEGVFEPHAFLMYGHKHVMQVRQPKEEGAVQEHRASGLRAVHGQGR